MAPKKYEMKLHKLATSGWKAILQTVAVFLLTTGSQQIQNGDYLTGGTVTVIGFILFLLANYAGLPG